MNWQTFHWAEIGMAFGAIVATWFVQYATRKTFKDPIVRVALTYITLFAMTCIISFAIIRQVDVALCIGVATVFGTIGMFFAYLATIHHTKPTLAKK